MRESTARSLLRMRGRRLLSGRALGQFFCASVFAAALALHADPLDTWQMLNPLPKENTITSVSYGNGLWVAVGGNGTILTSPFPITGWTERTSGTLERLSGISYGNGLWVAVGGTAPTRPGPIGPTWWPAA